MKKIDKVGRAAAIWHFIRTGLDCFMIDHPTSSHGAFSRRQAKCRIPADTAGQRLIEFLAGRFAYHTEPEWRCLVEAGQVLVNHKAASTEDLLRFGDMVEYMPPDLPEPAVNSDFKIVYEDDHLLVIDKPGNLPVHPAGAYFHHTLWALLRETRPGEVIRFVNRLDRETSGLLLAGKTAAVCAECVDALSRPDARKEYLALVEGDFPDVLTADGWLARRDDSLIRKKTWFMPGERPPPEDSAARRVRTRFASIYSAGKLSLVKAWLDTGRTHQIRASLEYFGFPLVGDKIYGVDETVFLRFIDGGQTAADKISTRLPRQALHAARLVMRHPVTGCLSEWRAPLPDDMLTLIKNVGGNRFVRAAELATAGTTL
ncbi:MAG: RluA family pseudouridine synthase [Lentisphaeria bacterium]|nr:RluA family pseudouridine synthase [Lentisphaeria bacterium]